MRVEHRCRRQLSQNMLPKAKHVLYTRTFSNVGKKWKRWLCDWKMLKFFTRRSQKMHSLKNEIDFFCCSYHIAKIKAKISPFIPQGEHVSKLDKICSYIILVWLNGSSYHSHFFTIVLPPCPLWDTLDSNTWCLFVVKSLVKLKWIQWLKQFKCLSELLTLLCAKWT